MFRCVGVWMGWADVMGMAMMEWMPPLWFLVGWLYFKD